MKRLVTHCHALSIRELAECSLYPFSRYDWVWRTHKGTQETSVTVTVLEDSIQLSFLIHGYRILQDVRLRYSIGPHGGKRPWFACPTCPRRVGALYHASGLPFRCRICCKLAYPSQYQSRIQSYGRQHRMVSHREQVRLSAQCAMGT